MLFYNGKQLIEGIDSIDLRLQADIPNCFYLDLSKQLDPKHRISVYTKAFLFRNENGYFSPRLYFYLHISGEYINPELPLKETIAIALYQMFIKKILCIKDHVSKKEYTYITKDFICNNLSYFFSTIKVLEFCFDFKRYQVRIFDDVKMIDVSTANFHNILEDKLLDRDKCLFKDDTTIYSNDYKPSRKSTLKCYDRENWLIKKGNEYPIKFIKNNPYKTRIEFVLKMYSNTTYLTPNILEYNYEQLIRYFTPYLARLYKKYFLGKVIVNDYDHPYFNIIYTLADSDVIRANGLLENYNTTKRNTNNHEEFSYFKLNSLMKKEDRKHDKILLDLPNSYFAGFDNFEEFKKDHMVTPYDIINEDKILYKDDDIVILKNQMITLDLKRFKIEDEN